MSDQTPESATMEALRRQAGAVAHDLNNLLTVIRGESDLAMIDLPEHHPARESLTAIRRASRQAVELTDRLLALSARPTAEPAAAEGDGRPPAVAGTDPVAILVVEDDAAVRRLACRILNGDGYLVLDAGDGEEALTVLATRQDPVDLLLTDVVMPRLGGHALARRATAGGQARRVLFMSGQTDVETRQRRLEGEPPFLLRKPFTRDALLRQVRVALAQAAAAPHSGESP